MLDKFDSYLHENFWSVKIAICRRNIRKNSAKLCRLFGVYLMYMIFQKRFLGRIDSLHKPLENRMDQCFNDVFHYTYSSSDCSTGPAFVIASKAVYWKSCGIICKSYMAWMANSCLSVTHTNKKVHSVCISLLCKHSLFPQTYILKLWLKKWALIGKQSLKPKSSSHCSRNAIHFNAWEISPFGKWEYSRIRHSNSHRIIYRPSLSQSK
jgi:hypothetical protein